jgi:hypothetical protein
VCMRGSLHCGAMAGVVRVPYHAVMTWLAVQADSSSICGMFAVRLGCLKAPHKGAACCCVNNRVQCLVGFSRHITDRLWGTPAMLWKHGVVSHLPPADAICPITIMLVVGMQGTAVRIAGLLYHAHLLVTIND